MLPRNLQKLLQKTYHYKIPTLETTSVNLKATETLSMITYFHLSKELYLLLL